MENNAINTSGIKERDIILCIILSILTLGIYLFVWLAKINNEINQLSDEEGPSGLLVVFLYIITCGIYGLYWVYKIGQKIDKIDGSKSTGIVFLIIAIYKYNLINMIIMQNKINNLLLANSSLQ